MLFIHWDHQWRHLTDIFIVILTIVRGCVRSQYCDGRAKRVNSYTHDNAGLKIRGILVANATMFSHLLPGFSCGSKHLLLP